MSHENRIISELSLGDLFVVPTTTKTTTATTKEPQQQQQQEPQQQEKQSLFLDLMLGCRRRSGKINSNRT